MDTYLFGDDGSGMLEGLTDLDGTDTFTGNPSSGVTVDKDNADSSYRQPYGQGNVSQEESIQKLTSFSGGSGSGVVQPVATASGGPQAPEYHEYNAYPSRPRLPPPSHAPLHTSHHVHPSHPYSGYDPMYGLTEHPGIGDMSVWSGGTGTSRYSSVAPVYRHGYDHQQKIHQYPGPQQGAALGVQGQNVAYMARQPHFSQTTAQVYGQQNYPNYTQMHPPTASRISQHPSYHQQLDVNTHQYGLPHGQQSHAPIPQHQPHPSLGSHTGGGITSGIQSHPSVHIHHGAPSVHHVSRQTQLPPSSNAPSHLVPSQIPYGSPHHTVPMSYQPHQPQHPLDVNVTNQYSTPKPPGIEGSPQYRPPFPQLSPQISPRAQISPRPQQPQLSPIPVMSPVKGPSASPHGPRNLVQSPVLPTPQSGSSSFPSHNTLQALEQMVLPAGTEYPYQRTPASPIVGHGIASPSHWTQSKISAPLNNLAQIECNDSSTRKVELPAQVTLLESVKNVQKVGSMEIKNLDTTKSETIRSNENLNLQHPFLPGSDSTEILKERKSNDDADTNSVNNSIKTVSSAVKVSEPSTLLSSHSPSDTITECIPNFRNDQKLEDDVRKSPNNELKYDSDKQSIKNASGLSNKEEVIDQITHLPTTSTASINTSTSEQISASRVSLQYSNTIALHTNSTPTNFENKQPPPRNLGYQNNSNIPKDVSPGLLPITVQTTSTLPISAPSTSLQGNVIHSVPANFQTVLTPGSHSITNGQTNLQSNNSIQNLNHPNPLSNIPMHNVQNNLNCLPPGMINVPPNLQSNISNNMTSIQSNQSSSTHPIPVGIPISNQNVQSNPTVINIPQNHNTNMMLVGPNTIPHPDIPTMYPNSHQQERAALQQQIQEMYCLPPSNENQNKVRCMQDRLALLQQHEANDKCSGGPNCILQSTIYGGNMVESPQVSSTTGRGRGKGPAKPRKPRAKKEKINTVQSLDQLPVSEDCVTAGRGLQMTNEVDMELGEDISTLDSSTMSVTDIGKGKKKPRTPRKKGETKARVPKQPKVPKIVGEKPIKERKKRQPKDPNAPKRRRNSKKDISDFQADITTTTSLELVEKGHQPVDVSISNLENTLTKEEENASADALHVTDFDDIPVSRIAVKDLMDEVESKRDQTENDDFPDCSSQKKKSKKRISCKKTPVKRTPGGRKKKRGGIVPESDGEPDDMMSTPPPSPPLEDDSLKRRSARNTQRKKYTDDVMIRLSDDEYTVIPTDRIEKERKLEEVNPETKDVPKLEVTPKPNYIYVNTTEEDAMIVQHVLACRMGKREIKPEPLINENINLQTEDVVSPENIEIVSDTLIKPLDKNDSILLGISDKNSNSNEKSQEVDMISDDHDNVDKSHKNEGIAPATVTKDNLESKTIKPVLAEVEEYFVKYRNFSYLHCEWKTEEELYKGDKRIFSKIKRFKQKQAQQLNIFELLDDEPFNPDYVEVERILDMSENQDPGNNTVVTHYLVKWKSLQYEDSTWELEEDIDSDKIKQYKCFSEIPPKEKWKFKKRPQADHWVQLKESPVYKGGNTLRPYQLEGLNWLLFSWHNNRNCILADEMGLGKTIQSLTFVNSVWEYGIRGPFLIIAPLSTIPNWQREFEAWTEMNVIVYHGSQQSKSMIQEYEFYFKNENSEPIKEITKFNVLITTFEIIVTDFAELKSFNWRICVIDEAHRLKNRNCKLLEGLRQLHLEHRVLLSGTPLQNNVNELFSLLNFLEPSQFSSSEAFLNEFGQLKTESEVLKLQALLKPMMLRRLKEDVEKTLAPKEETIIEVELTNIQKKYYRAILERNFSFLQKGTASAANIPNLMNTMMELRKCCIHPYLLNGAEDQIQFDYKQTHGEDKEAYYKALIQSSGKMVLVDKLLPKLKAGGHRVLIFSQMVRCLDILEDYLMFRKYAYERIDGRIRGNLRQEAIDRFSKPDSDRFVFLLCTKAGGLGINLTAADTVIIYDSDWNPQNDLQAQARCHRIGQQKMVKIYRLICRNTYEKEMFDKASLKLGLDKAVLQSMNTAQGKETGLKQLSKKEIEDLLKKGAYGAVMDEDNAGDKFCEEDIEMILARRTQVIQMESEKGSTFSKASFAATDQRSDIDIRDPDFWNKWAKKAEIDTTEKKEDEDLIVTEPRKRTIIKRYGHDDGPMEMSDMEVTPDSEEDDDGISLRSKRKKEKLGKKGRRYGSDDYIPRHEGVPVDEEVVYGSWTRSECFKIERGLLTFGWARWEEILDKNQFRKGWTLPVIEDCARIIVLFCLRHYKGDEKIRNFIWDLIEPCENGEVTISRNHSGLHNPVPRGRNAKKKNRIKDVPKLNDLQKWEDMTHWCSNEKYDCEAYLESSYKKHLFRHANKVLLRVRMMYYIKHEVIGDYAMQIDNGVDASLLGMRVPRGVDSTPPRLWWDTECDVSLLVGTYKHGYENYFAMRSDPQLCFVGKLGPPDDAECTDIKSEERKVRGSGVGDEDCTDDVSSGAGATSPAASPRPDEESFLGGGNHLWPSMQDLNTRLRRLITAYQRNYKREELKMQQRAKMERRDRMDQLARDEVTHWRWTRADEEAFRRTVASYGVEFDPATKSLRWSRFRTLAGLDTKSDDTLTDYLKAFMAMCKRQCGLSVGEAELPTRVDLKAEPIGEERAIATLERIDLLRVLREEVAPHPALEARLALCERTPDAPSWWQPARHDKLLVLGVCKHGLGDTYRKLFCDRKLPFAECAQHWYESTQKSTKDDSRSKSSDEDDQNNSISEPRSLRRSKRSSNACELDEDTDALSELETLAKVGRADEYLSPDYWFSERALETRLHHIAHAVQNCEWPSIGMTKTEKHEKQDERNKQSQKRHIAIDVETERAKLHALLSSPQAAHSQRIGVMERDDASSDSGSRRSTPAPPPAHQRVAPSPSPAAITAPAPTTPSPALVDLSAPLDLSEAQDFSMGRRTPVSVDTTLTSNTATRSRLDDTLTKLMKRKNVPAPEQIVGKEKKRKKLDEIVLGLSAAKCRSSIMETSPVIAEKPQTVLPDVTVMPAAPPVSNPVVPIQKPFSVTVTSASSPITTSKELSSYLQQSVDQSKKNIKVSPTIPMKSYSHEAKVNKWLSEQVTVDPRRRGLSPRLAPDEHVPVVHRVTGKRITGHKAPQLKHLAQWIAENPMYDIDSKWTEGIKEHVKLPSDVRSQRHSPMQASSTTERKKGRPPTLDSSSNVYPTNSSMNQAAAGLNPALLASLSSLSAFDPKTLATTLSSLTGIDPMLLSTFDPKLLSSLNSLDPKNNPLLNSFSAMPNLLGNMAGGNIFANLAGLGLSGFPSFDMNSLNTASAPSDNKSKVRKPSEAASTSNPKSASSQFPFVFPNPNMLYPQLGLSGLNPFGMHSSMTSSYDGLGLLASNLAASSGSTTYPTHASSRSSSKSTVPRSTSSTVVTNSSASRQQKSPLDRQQVNQLPQLLLPPDPYLLETLSKQSIMGFDSVKPDKRSRDEDNDQSATDLSKSDKKNIYDTLKSHVPPEFAAVQEKLLRGDKKDIDISKMLLEQMASGALSASLVSCVESKKVKENDKDAYEKLNKSSSEYISKTLSSAENMSVAHKRSHEKAFESNYGMQSSNVKKLKESDLEILPNMEKQPDNSNTGEMDLEDLIAPSTVIKMGIKNNENSVPKMMANESATTSLDADNKTNLVTQDLSCLQTQTNLKVESGTNAASDNKECREQLDDGNNPEDLALTESGRKVNKKKGRKSCEDNVSFGPRRELRSNAAGRQSSDMMSNH